MRSNTMPPSLDDASFVVVGNGFEDEEDGDCLSTESPPDMSGTLILPSAPETTTFTPPSSIDSDIPSLDLGAHKHHLLVPDDDDDMEGIDDPLLEHHFPNVDDDIPSKPEPSLSKTPNSSWNAMLQDSSSRPHRRSLLFFYLPVLVAVLGMAAYTNHLDSLRLRDLEKANQMREREHQQRIIQLQQEIEALKKKHQSGFTFTLPEATTWITTTLDDSQATTQSIMNRWNTFKNQARNTVNDLRTAVQNDYEQAKEWWDEQQQLVIEKLKEDASRFTDDDDQPPPDQSGEEKGTDAEDSNKGKNLMPSKKTILVSAAVVSVASVLLGTAFDSFFGNSPSQLPDYETFDPFGVPLADFVE